MSNSAIDWAIASNARGSAKAVLFVLANQARDKAQKSRTTGKLWPPLHVWMGHASIASQAGIDVKTVPAALAKLEALGLILRAGSDGGTGQVKVYQLLAKDPESGSLCSHGKNPESGDLVAGEHEGKRSPVSSAKDPVFPAKVPVFPMKHAQKRGTYTQPMLKPKKKTKVLPLAG